MKERLKFYLILALVLFVVGLGLTMHLRYKAAEKRWIAERILNQRLALDKAGLERALSTKPKEIVNTIIKWFPEAKEVTKSGVRPVATAEVRTVVERVEVPVPVTADCPAPTPLDISVQNRAQVAVFTTSAGDVAWKARLWTTLSTADGWREEIETRNAEADVQVSDDIIKALRDAAPERKQSFVARHLGFTCPAVGVTLAPDGRVGAGITCSYGWRW